MSDNEKSLAELMKERQEQKKLEKEREKKDTPQRRTSSKVTEEKLDKILSFLEEKKSEKVLDLIFEEDKETDEKKGIFTIRFLGYIAAEMGIINYGNIPKAQLMLKVGKIYIEKSGLVK